MPFPRSYKPRTSSLTLTLLALACSEGNTERGVDTTPAPTVGAQPPTSPSAGSGSSNPIITPGPAGSANPSDPGTPPMEVVTGIIITTPPQGVSSCDVDAVPADPEAEQLLAPFAVSHDDIVRRTIYSWTVPEQISELRADPTLLTKSMTSDGERGRAADLILESAETDEIAAMLAAPQFEKRRFGWSNPWATLLGWSGEDYGDRLLAITLRPDAWVGRMLATRDSQLTWAFFDMDGNPVENSQVLADPQRLAMVYFVDERDSPECRGSLFRAGSIFREYFVLNESMIESYQAGTTELKAEIDRGITALEALLKKLNTGDCNSLNEGAPCWRERVAAEWWTARELDNVQTLYEHALAFPNTLYEPTISNIETLLERLRAVPFDGDPLVYEYPDELGALEDGGAPENADASGDAGVPRAAR